MQRKHLLDSLTLYSTSHRCSEEEQHYYHTMISFVKDNPDCFNREHVGHITGSAWVINNEQTHVLLTHHKKLNSWFQLGGHADGDPHIPGVALKEAQEESGIQDLFLVYDEIFDIDIHPIATSCAMHYDVRYLIQAPQGAQYRVSHESHDLAWVPFESVHTYSTERSVLRMVEKMNQS